VAKQLGRRTEMARVVAYGQKNLKKKKYKENKRKIDRNGGGD
jgi:hypothetical protein